MARIQQSIVVNVPLQVAYNQLTQFEEFPRFLEGVEAVRQIDDTHLHWHARTGTQEQHWDAEITEQIPDRLIALRNVRSHAATARIELSASGDATTVSVLLDMDPQLVAAFGSATENSVEQRLEQDLVRFKKFMELRQQETGAWRGEVKGGQVVRSDGETERRVPGIEAGKAIGQTPDEHGESLQSGYAGPAAARRADGRTQGATYAAGTEGWDGNEDPGLPVVSSAENAPSKQTDPNLYSSRNAGDAGNAHTSFNQGGTNAAGASAAKSSAAGSSAFASSSSTHADTPSGSASSFRYSDNPTKGGHEENGASWLPNLFQRWDDPMAMMKKMREEMDQIFEKFTGRSMPSMSAMPRMSDMADNLRSKMSMESGRDTPGRDNTGRDNRTQAGSWTPAVDISQQGSQLIVSADLPGVKRENVQIEISQDKLIIEGDRFDESHGQIHTMRRTERSYGHFYRAISLPEGIDPDRASASMQDGILQVTVPVEPGRRKGRRIDITSSR